MVITFNKKCTWVIAYINRDFIYRVEQDIQNFCRAMGKKVHKAEHMSAYIPTVRILRKQFKGKEIFEEVPLLFNYGFFQIPNDNLDTDFLIKMKEHILCIHQWVKDSKALLEERPHLITGKELVDKRGILQYATATSGEINRLLDAHKKVSIYDKFDVDNLKHGTVINLKGYPFDNIDAKVLAVDKVKEKIKVELLIDGLIKKTTVSFDNVLYTVYHGLFDETDFKEKSIEEMQVKGKNYESKYMSNE